MANRPATLQFSSPRGICAVLGAIGEDRLERSSAPPARPNGRSFPGVDPEIDTARRFAIDRGILGTRVFIEPAPLCSIHLANNLADLLFTSGDSPTPEAEILRVLRPGGVAHVGDRQVVKPMPEGTDAWSHPYHTPDNNTLSTDRLARAPYLTQFMAEPMFSPMPEVTVAAGGRVFKACGHIAHKKNQNQQLNTLLGINGYNGTILWTRPLAEGFMIHRNTMIATPEVLYLADDVSCKVIDAATGKTLDEIVVDLPQADGPVWKWMAAVDGVLYAIVGGKEVAIHSSPRTRPGQPRDVGGARLPNRRPTSVSADNPGDGPEEQKGSLGPPTSAARQPRRLQPMAKSTYCPEIPHLHLGRNGKTSGRTTRRTCSRSGQWQGRTTLQAAPQRTSVQRNRLFSPARSGSSSPRRPTANALDEDRGNVQVCCATAASTWRALDSVKPQPKGDILARLHRRACTRDGHDRQHLLSSQRRHGPSTWRRMSPITSPRPPARDGVLVSDGHLLGPVDVRLPAFRLWPHRPRPAGDFNFHPGLGGDGGRRVARGGGTAAGRRQLDLLPRRLRGAW